MSDKSSPTKPGAPGHPSFTDQFAPKHEGLERWKHLESEDRAEGLRLFAAAIPPEQVKRDRDYLERYMGTDFGPLFQDAEDRPKHYTQRQHAIIDALRTGKPANPPATAAERNDLMLQMLRSTAAAKTEQQVKQKLRPKPKQPHPSERKSFEDQEDFGPTIKII